jgi:hypothetical protein
MSGDVEHSKNIAQCPQKAKFNKRQKILAVLNSMLEEKRRESLDVDFVDSSTTCFEEEFSGSPKEQNDADCSEVLVICKNGRKRSISETVNHEIEDKKPLVENSTCSSNEACSKAGGSLDNNRSKAGGSLDNNRHQAEHSTGSKGLLGDYPSVASRPNAQSRCMRQKHSAFSEGSSPDYSGTHFGKFSRSHCEGQMRNGSSSYFVDHSRFAAETVPEDSTFRCREYRSMEIQRALSSRMDCSTIDHYNDQHRNRSPLHDQRHMRQIRRGLLGDCPSTSSVAASGFGGEPPRSAYDIRSGQFLDPEIDDDGCMLQSIIRLPSVSTRDL